MSTLKMVQESSRKDVHLRKPVQVTKVIARGANVAGGWRGGAVSSPLWSDIYWLNV